ARWHSVLTHPRLFYRYLRWDWTWQSQFRQDVKQYFLPTLKTLQFTERQDLPQQSLVELEQGIEQITEVLSQLFDHFLRGQLILRGRRSLLQIQLDEETITAQFAALQAIAADIQNLNFKLKPNGKRYGRAALFAQLADMPDGKSVFQQVDQWLEQYGDGADYPWELAQKRWRESAGSIRQRITDYLYKPAIAQNNTTPASWQAKQLAQTIELQQEIQTLTELFLAQFRWHLLAIAEQWQNEGYLSATKDIFWLNFSEICAQLQTPDPQQWPHLQLTIQYRRSQLILEQTESEPPPPIIYGQLTAQEAVSSSCFLQKLHGQGASQGSVIGQVRLCPYWQQPPKIKAGDILVTPYLHENLFAYLPELKGVITTKGGLLSQGASLARQQHLPMIINATAALEKLQSGQWVRLDGHSGQVELLDPDTLSIGAG
ncbi:MAG: PEP-utilizing enzyme, partial [Limnothrix sp.]